MDSTSPQFFSSGSTLLDLALSNGWGENRIINIIGDSATGKTLLAITAAAQYRAKHQDRFIDYVEAEKAFNVEFARSRGLPEENLAFPECLTVEDFFKHLTAKVEKGQPGLVILDSLDALTTEDERDRDISKGSYGADKAKLMSELFRRINQPLSKVGITLIVVSQTRDKLGVMFGKKWTRAGGNALEFYSSQILVLSHLNNLTREINGVKYTLGTTSMAVINKNRFGPNFRRIPLPILFTIGIDDIKACLDWLKSVGCLEKFEGCEKVADAFQLLREARGTTQFTDLVAKLQEATKTIWADIESKIRDASSFYGEDASTGETAPADVE